MCLRRHYQLNSLNSFLVNMQSWTIPRIPLLVTSLIKDEDLVDVLIRIGTTSEIKNVVGKHENSKVLAQRNQNN